MNFILTQWDLKYMDDLYVYANNKKIADNLRNVFPHPYTRDDAEIYIKDCMEKGDENNICRAIIADGKVIGSIGIFVKDDVYSKSAELGYWLAEEFWGKGIIPEAINQICNIAFEKFDIVRIYAEPFAHNKGSRRVLEKAGFELEAVLKNSVYKNGKIGDSCIYALLK